MTKTAWTRSSLVTQGFVGWEPWRECADALKAIPPEAGGVYLVFRADQTAPVFLERSAGGQHKRNDPSVSRDVLEANWVDASVVYIGKGNHGQLRTRLKEYAKAGAGKNHGHHGGRLIWQLAGGQDLLVAWQTLPAELAPLREEKRMIYEFRESYGKPPFANDPHRQGR